MAQKVDQNPIFRLVRIILGKIMTSSKVQRLFDRTLLGNYEDDGAWEAVSTLRSSGNHEIFKTAAEWLKADSPLKRARGAAVLAQLRAPAQGEHQLEPDWLFRDEAFSLLVEMLARESDAMVLDSGIAALGHLYNEAGIPIIVRYADHPDQDVRFSVACALGHFPNDPLAVATLIPLTRDEDSDVRDWSVFGLGVQGSVDSPEIREVLLQRLTDSDEDVREEAAVGLGKRQDLRLLPILRTMLAMPVLKLRVAEAASALLGLPADPDEWEVEDYKAALNDKFGTATTDLTQSSAMRKSTHE